MEMHLVHLNTKFRSPMDALAPAGISDADRKRAMLVIALFVNVCLSLPTIFNQINFTLMITISGRRSG